MFIFRKKIVFIPLILIGVILVIVFLKSNNNDLSFEKETISLSSMVQIVNETGIVKSSESVDLSLVQSGKIISVPGFKGKVVSSGEIIVQLDSKDVQKSIRDAETSLENAKLSLEKIKIQQSVENINSDLVKAYDDGFTAVSNAFLDLSPTLTGLNDLFAEQYLSDNDARMIGKTAQDYRNKAENSYYIAQKSYSINEKIYRKMSRDSNNEDIDNIINEIYTTTKLVSDAIKDFRNYVDYLVNDTGNISFYSTYQNILAIYTNTINSHLTTLLQNKTDIKNFKESFPTSDLDIRSYEILVRQKEDLLKDAKSRISDYYIRAPFDGIITDISVSPGEFASVGSPIVSMISKDKNEVSVDITEDDIAFVDVGDEASITFDAFDDLLVKAKVTYISPNTKTKDGVAVFEVILQITENVKQIKVGLSADVDIFTEKLTNVIVIPRRSIIEEDGNRFVRLLIDDSTYKKQIISTGLQGEDGLVEVKDGLVVGDTIITFIDKKELVNLTEIK